MSIKLPALSSMGSPQAEDSDEPVVNHLQSKDASASAFSSQDQQIPDLVTLSLLPKSQWQSLINLDIIKVFLCLHYLLFSVELDKSICKK